MREIIGNAHSAVGYCGGHRNDYVECNDPDRQTITEFASGLISVGRERQGIADRECEEPKAPAQSDH